MKVIFHHPHPLILGNSGSTIRPIRVRDAMLRRGIEVHEITGDLEERKQKFNALKASVARGETYAYMYSEGLSRPINLAIRNIAGFKTLRRENFDLDVMDFALAHNIPVGYYLRDLHWDFFTESFGHLDAAKYLYFKMRMQKYGRREIKFLQNRGVHLFCPSQRFSDYLTKAKSLRATPLPPGANIRNSKPRTLDPNHIKLLYVGGVSGLYSPRRFLESINVLPEVHLTLCTREEEWKNCEIGPIPENVEVIHHSGNKLFPMYDAADIGVYSPPPKNYISLAFSMKIPEYIANGLPILAYEGTEVADFIKANNIGWVVRYNAASVRETLRALADRPEEYAEKQGNILKLQPSITWNALVDNIERHILSK